MPETAINAQNPPIAETEIGQPAPATFARPARDVPVGTNWAFRDHRTMKKVIADERAARRAATSYKRA